MGRLKHDTVGPTGLDQITARVVLARFPAGAGAGLEAVEHLLQRLLAAAEAGGRTGIVIEIFVLQALTHQAGGDTRNALALLEEALTPGGTRRLRAGVGR